MYGRDYVFGYTEEGCVLAGRRHARVMSVGGRVLWGCPIKNKKINSTGVLFGFG
jgi:hypothetical protein